MHRSRSRFLTLALGASMLLLGSIAVTPASADTITFNFTGDVTKVQGLANPPFSVSIGTMSGFLTVDSTNNGTSGHYNILNFSVTVQGQTYTHTVALPGFFGVEITNGTPGQDRFDVTVPELTGPSVLADPGPGTLTPADFNMELSTVGGTSVWTSNALPTTVPSISSFDHKTEWRLNFAPGEKQVSGTITALTAVPLPASLILFSAGLVALISLGARNWRQKKSGLA